MNPKVRSIINFLNANLHRKLSLDEMAGSIGFSRSHFCRLLKTETGRSPGQYLQIIRMQKAAKLLATSLMSVKQVMLEVGYNNKGLFARHFKKAHGHTPSEYRTIYFDLNLINQGKAQQDRDVS
ncbi:MAG: hypothetical protein V7641_4719 [Blastocatellia bacterium]